uniref:Uncharacterized protein n=1 Tax=Musa acuminata subsp. malaccensis TaxID=214687 RepID=A0A804KD43_MUSAM
MRRLGREEVRVPVLLPRVRQLAGDGGPSERAQGGAPAEESCPAASPSCPPPAEPARHLFGGSAGDLCRVLGPLPHSYSR